MKFTLTLSPEQLDALAEVVARKLGSRTPEADALTVSQAAKRLGVSEQTVRRRVDAGLIPTIPHLGVARIPTAALRSMLHLNTDSQ